MTMIQGGGGHLVTAIQAILASTTSDVCLPPPAPNSFDQVSLLPRIDSVGQADFG